MKTLEIKQGCLKFKRKMKNSDCYDSFVFGLQFLRSTLSGSVFQTSALPCWTISETASCLLSNITSLFFCLEDVFIDVYFTPFSLGDPCRVV